MTKDGPLPPFERAASPGELRDSGRKFDQGLADDTQQSSTL
jgi:hypothetical protein